MSIVFNYAARSDVGLVRRNNQDSAYAGPHLAVMADGMGGPAGGDIASSVAVAHLSALDSDSHGADDLLSLLRGAVNDAHQELKERSTLDPELAGLGTTCIALLRSGNKLAMVHVGDSRAYLLRDGQFTQVTTDHTFVNFLVQTGRLTEEEAARHPQRSVILRTLGDSTEALELDESVREARAGDRWLLCSDGLSGVVSADTIATVVSAGTDPDTCADVLVDLALRAGAPDNVSVVVVDVLDDATSDVSGLPTAPQVVGSAATNRLARSRGGTSAAARAAALTSPAAEGEGGESERAEETSSTGGKRGRWRRRLAFSFAGLVLLGALLFGASMWAQSYYYVIGTGATVEIYRGIPQQLGPIQLSEKYEDTGVSVESLAPGVRARLQTAVIRPSLQEARDYVSSLEVQRMAVPTPTPDVGATPGLYSPASPSPTPASPAPASPAPSTPATATPAASTAPAVVSPSPTSSSE
ncbi:PP2C family protein-serine/threonine phosphatase [Buchananella felis]|uniref:PP2C family protein-serine/threonine phosphatase n=1 Tax=Buchananella felis TaxID=3231492 RepID=UPI003528DCDE